MIIPFVQESPDPDGTVVVSASQIDSLGSTVEIAVEQLADSVGAAATHVVEALGSPSWWEIGSSLAAIVVAILAAIELWRIYQHRKEAQRRAAAQVSAIAIPVHRSIKSWTDELPSTVDQMEQRHQQGTAWAAADAAAARDGWAYWVARSQRGHIGKTEKRIERLNAEAPFAEKSTKDRVIRATAAFYRAFDELNLVMAMPWGDPQQITAFPPMVEHRERLSTGHARLRQCISELDSLINEEFKKAAE